MLSDPPPHRTGAGDQELQRKHVYRDSQGCSRRAPRDFLGGPLASRSAPVDPDELVGPSFPKPIWFSLGFLAKVETCAIMEREARNVQERQYAGNRKE
jgi:hypothetical protein